MSACQYITTVFKAFPACDGHRNIGLTLHNGSVKLYKPIKDQVAYIGDFCDLYVTVHLTLLMYRFVPNLVSILDDVLRTLIFVTYKTKPLTRNLFFFFFFFESY